MPVSLFCAELVRGEIYFFWQQIPVFQNILGGVEITKLAFVVLDLSNE